MIKNNETGWNEATIVVNGRELTFAESMSVRVAVGHFRMWLNNADTRAAVGVALTEGYNFHLRSVEEQMLFDK